MPLTGQPAPRRPRPKAWIAVLATLAIWSLVAWLGYISVDGVLGWVAANAGLVVDSGKNLATATGVGKEAGSVVDSLNVSSLFGQAIALLQIVLKPAIVGLWAVGALAIVAAPLILSKIGRLLAARRR